MRIKGSDLKKIIKEEISRMNEGLGGDVPKKVGYTVRVKNQPKTREGIEAMQEEAFENAVARAQADYPGTDWELRSEFKGDTGMRVYRSPSYPGDVYAWTVFLELVEPSEEYFDPEVGGYDPDDLADLPGGEMQKYMAGEKVSRRY